MNTFEHVPPLPNPFRWIRNHSRHQFEIWANHDLLKVTGKPLAIITDEVLSHSKEDMDEALESFVLCLIQEGVLK